MITADSIQWLWNDNSDNESGFNVWADAGAGGPSTLRVTTPTGTTQWTMSGLAPDTQYSFQMAVTSAEVSSDLTPLYTARTFRERNGASARASW